MLDRFCMADAKPLGVPLQPYDKISKEDCPKTQEAITDMLILQLVVHLCMLWLLLDLILPMQ